MLVAGCHTLELSPTTLHVYYHYYQFLEVWEDYALHIKTVICNNAATSTCYI